MYDNILSSTAKKTHSIFKIFSFIQCVLSDNGATFGSLLMLGNDGTLNTGVKNQKEKNKPSFILLSPCLESFIYSKSQDTTSTFVSSIGIDENDSIY
jgi:hypothetical protein